MTNKVKKEVKESEDTSEVKMATEEQMQTIKEYMKLFSSDLIKDMNKIDLITRIASAQGLYQPVLSENYLQDMNFNPNSASSEQINAWLESPQYFSGRIRHLSEYLENAVGQYGRAIGFFNTIKSFNYMIMPADSNNEKLVNDKAYQHSYDMCLDILRKMNIKYQFPKMDLATMEDGVSFWVKQETNDNITFLQLPTDYCYITAPWTYGWEFAIDLTYFDRMIAMPNILPELTEAYKEFIKKRQELVEGDSLAPYQYYKLPVESSFCLTWNPGRVDKLPPLSMAMGASLDVLSYRDLLKKKSLLDLWKLIPLKIPMSKSNDKMIIPYQEASQIVSMIQGLLPENIMAFATPFETEEIGTNQVQTLNNLTELADNNVFSALGLPPMAFGKDSKTAGALQISTDIAFEWCSTHMYSQFANLVNWLIMNKTKGYKWQVKFFGNKLRKDKELEGAVKLASTCNFPLEYVAANAGFEPFEIEGLMNWTNKRDFKSKFKPLESQFVQSGKADSEGAPRKDISDMKERWRKI